MTSTQILENVTSRTIFDSSTRWLTNETAATTTTTHRSLSSIETTPYPFGCGLDLHNGELPLVLFITLVVNALSVAVLWRMRGSSDSVDHLLISILNLNDLLTTAIFTVTWVAGRSTCGTILQDEAVCGFTGWLGSSMLVWSGFIILIITTLRFLSLVKPFYYRKHVNARTVMKSSVVTLTFSLALFLFPFTGLPKPYVPYTHNLICSLEYAPGGYNAWQRAFIGFIGSMATVSVIFVAVCNALIIKSLSGHNMVHTSSISAITATTFPAIVRPRPLMTSPTRRRSAKRRIFQRVTLVVSFVYVLCYAPFGIRLLVDTAYNLDHQEDLAHSVTLILLFLSPLLNPFIYGLFNKHFRGTLISMLRCRKSGEEVSHETANCTV